MRTTGVTTDAQGMDAVIASLIEERNRFVLFVERRVGDHAVAEDLVQSAYARAVTQIDGLRDASAVRAWFYRMLRNAVIDFYRHRSVVERAVKPMEEGFDAPMAVGEQKNLCRCMERAIDALKPEYAQVLREIELADNDSGAMETFAERAGITLNNAGVRVFRARKALARDLRRICGSCAGSGCLDCNCAEDTKDTKQEVAAHEATNCC